jgi:GNAT superfamily N-acetyltransferase
MFCMTNGVDQIRLRLGDKFDGEFIFECLCELRGTTEYCFQQFEQYIDSLSVLDSGGSNGFFIGVLEEERIGILSWNRFLIPRFLGYGYELEEVVVLPKYQRNGFGGRMLEEFLAMIKNEEGLRKVIVKTDDASGAGTLYNRYFSESELRVYSKSMNLI